MTRLVTLDRLRDRNLNIKFYSGIYPTDGYSGSFTNGHLDRGIISESTSAEQKYVMIGKAYADIPVYSGLKLSIDVNVKEKEQESLELEYTRLSPRGVLEWTKDLNVDISSLKGACRSIINEVLSVEYMNHDLLEVIRSHYRGDRRVVYTIKYNALGLKGTFYQGWSL